MRKIHSAMVVAVAVIALFATSAFAAHSACPSGGTPAPGSRVHGGLEVDGVCILKGVTVDGGVKIANNGKLQLETSTVNGRIFVDDGGEVDVNATTSGAGVPTGTTSTVNGGIRIDDSFDIDVWTARIDGGINMKGSGAFPVICGNEVDGESSFSSASGQIRMGGGTVSGVTCGGNSFHGTVSLSNVNVSMGGNTIDGDLLCTSSTVIVTAPNTITGKNTCY